MKTIHTQKHYTENNRRKKREKKRVPHTRTKIKQQLNATKAVNTASAHIKTLNELNKNRQDHSYFWFE